MSAPIPYEITTDFSQEEADNVSGRNTLRTAAVDEELVNIRDSITSLITNLTAIQRDDLALLDGIVRVHTLSSSVLALIGSAGFTIHDPLGWLTATVYTTREIVTQGTGTYVSAVAHTSGVFATDLAAGKWAMIFDSTSYTAAGIAFTPTGTIAASNVQSAVAEVASEALQKASNLSDLTNAATARTNISVLSSAQIQAASAIYAANTGTADALVVTFTPTIAAMANGMTLIVECTAPNTSIAPTITIDGLGPFTIKRPGNQNLIPGDMAGLGRALLSYESSTGYMKLLNPYGVTINVTGTAINSLAGGVADVGTYGDMIDINVTGTITSITSRVRGTRVAFTSVLGNTFIHDAASILMRHGATSTVLAGEVIEFVSLGSNIWNEIDRRDLPSRERVAFKLALSQLAR